MVFLHIRKENAKKEGAELNRLLREKKPVFALIYMEGCGPCNATRPEWSKLKHLPALARRQDIVIVDIDKDYIEDIPLLKENIHGFPTLRYFTEGGKKMEEYEDSSISKKDRTVDSFVEWIESKAAPPKKGGSQRRKSKSRKGRKRNTKNTKRRRRRF
jgi:thiol-disulfide isomerase/thioredoxin